jgi:predicted ferric reductase
MNEVPWTWFVMRSSGLVAVGLLTVSVLLGLIGPRLRPTARLSSISVHRAASVAGTLLIVAHIVLALLDKWIVLDWPAALLPGVAGWERWGIALGALAVDLMIVVLVTTATRLRTPRLWRRAHLLAYPVWALAVGHGLLVGTDGAVMQGLAMVCAATVLFGVAIRVLVRPRSARPVRPDLVGAGVVR